MNFDPTLIKREQKANKILNVFDAFILLVGFKLYAFKSSRIKALSRGLIIFKLS